MIGLLGRQGPGATLRQHCPQMTQRRCNTSSKTSFNCRLDHSLMTSCECYTFWTPSPLVTFPCTQIHEACQGPPHYSENTVFASLENFLPKSKGWPLPASLPKSAFHSKTLYLTESKKRGGIVHVKRCPTQVPHFGLHSYWGGQFILPQKANREKREFFQRSTMMLL